MTKEYTKAQFWKCVLQANSYSYIKYRGRDHELSEAQAIAEEVAS